MHDGHIGIISAEGSCTIWGDPHISPFDSGLFGAEPGPPVSILTSGDYWLVKNQDFKRCNLTWPFKAPWAIGLLPDLRLKCSVLVILVDKENMLCLTSCQQKMEAARTFKFRVDMVPPSTQWRVSHWALSLVIIHNALTVRKPTATSLCQWQRILSISSNF